MLWFHIHRNSSDVCSFFTAASEACHKRQKFSDWIMRSWWKFSLVDDCLLFYLPVGKQKPKDKCFWGSEDQVQNFNNKSQGGLGEGKRGGGGWGDTKIHHADTVFVQKLSFFHRNSERQLSAVTVFLVVMLTHTHTHTLSRQQHCSQTATVSTVFSTNSEWQRELKKKKTVWTKVW